MSFEKLLDLRFRFETGDIIDFGLRPIVDQLFECLAVLILRIFLPEKPRHLIEHVLPLTLDHRALFATGFRYPLI